MSAAPRASRQASVHGVLLVDKPEGPTSHDVVSKARRAFRTRAVGHAGTLDPMATGLLVLAVGQATKLVPYLTDADKAYEARVRLGIETDTLDALGSEARRERVPEVTAARVEAAAGAFVGGYAQIPPAYSAIKHRGRKLYEHARRGDVVHAPARRVELHSLRADLEGHVELRLRMACGKGFYVRSLARDLACDLGTVGHLVQLRRTRVGRFRVEDAVEARHIERASDDAEGGSVLESRLISLEEAARVLPTLGVSEHGVGHARHGRPIPADAVAWGALPEDPSTRVALFDAVSGRLIAIARNQDGRLRVVRGFAG